MSDDSGILSRRKILAHKERLESWLETGIGMPITAELDSTNKCRYRCRECSGYRIPEHASLTGSEMEMIIDKLSPVVKGLVFTGGGEPLENEETGRAIRYARRQGMDVGLVTNGFLLTDSQREGIVDTVLDDCLWARISIDASDAETYSQRRGTQPGDFDILVKYAQYFLEQKSKRGSNCTIGLAYLTRDETLDQLMAFVLLAREVGADYAQFRPYHNSNHDLSELIEQTKCMETDTFRVIYPKYKYEKKIQDYEKCFGDEFRVVVSATGEMYPDCHTRGRKNFSYGNLLRQSFDEIWYSEKRQEIFNSKLSQYNCPEMCRYDALNTLLWDLYQRKNGLILDSVPKVLFQHVNFV